MWLPFKVVLFTLTVCQSENVDRPALDSVFTEIGFTPSCVSQTLALCEDNQGSSLLQDMQDQQKPIIESIEDLKSEFENLKTDTKESKSVGEESKRVGEELKTIVGELKSDHEESKIVIEEMKSVVEYLVLSIKETKTIIEEMNCDVKTLKTSKVAPRNCADLLKMGDTQSGIRTLQIFPFRSCKTSFVSVYCDQTTDGGGWTVIQRREDLHEREDFYRDWAAYQQGFGSLGGEFWLGLDNIHALANQTKMELRVALEDYEGDKRWAKYDSFYITDSAGKYRLKLGKYEGNAGDSLTYHKDRPFSTKDVDNDSDNTSNCAQNRRGAWWYGECTDSNLNGFQYRGNFTSFADGIVWYKFRGKYYSLKSTVLSVRPAK